MLKSTLKKILPLSWQARLRRLSRLRWRTKVDVLASSQVRLRDVRWRHIAYGLWSPEVESHTYDVANVEELGDFIVGLVGGRRDEVLAHLHAAVRDPVFNEDWQRRMRRRFDVRHRVRLGNRLLWWGLARTMKPRVCVECGMYNGVGSLVLLRALQLNALEGAPGELISIDTDPSMGWVVPDVLTTNWTRVWGSTTDVLDDAIGERPVDLLIHDTPHTYDNARHEFTTALDHAAKRLVLLDSSGGTTDALAELCAANGGKLAFFREEPVNHVRAVSGTAVGLFER